MLQLIFDNFWKSLLLIVLCTACIENIIGELRKMYEARARWVQAKGPEYAQEINQLARNTRELRDVLHVRKN